MQNSGGAIGGRLLGVLEEADTGGGDAVAGGVFDEVHRFVGEVEQLGLGARIGGIGGDADAGGDLRR